MATVLQDPGVRSQPAGLQQFTQNLRADAETAVQNREYMGQAMVEQAQQYADSRGISMNMAMDENPALKQSVYTGLLNASRGNKEMAEQMFNAISGAQATRDQRFNYQLNKAIDSIDLNQPLFDQQRTYQKLVEEGTTITQDGVKLDTKALQELAGTMGEDTAIWEPIAKFINMTPATYGTDEAGNEIATSWGTEFNQVRDGILQNYLGISVDKYLEASPGSAERANYNKALINAMKGGNVSSVIKDSVNNVSKTTGPNADQSMAERSLWVVQDDKDIYAKLKNTANQTGEPQYIDEGAKGTLGAVVVYPDNYTGEEIRGANSFESVYGRYLDAADSTGSPQSVSGNLTIYPRAKQPIEGGMESPAPRAVDDRVFFQREGEQVQKAPVYETITETQPGYFSQYDRTEDLIRQQGGQAAQRSPIGDLDQRQKETQMRYMNAQIAQLQAAAMADPGMSEADLKILDTNLDLVTNLQKEQYDTDFMKTIKNPKDVEQWNKQVDNLAATLRAQGYTLDFSEDVAKARLIGSDIPIKLIGGVRKIGGASGGVPDYSSEIESQIKQLTGR